MKRKAIEDFISIGVFEGLGIKINKIMNFENQIQIKIPPRKNCIEHVLSKRAIKKYNQKKLNSII